MKRYRFTALGFFIIIVLLSGCATTSSYYERGHAALEQKNYREAIRNLKFAIVENIYNVKAIRDFGIAIYYRKKINLAERFLRLALSRLPNDPIIFYHLGMIYEETGQYDKAIRMYRRYVDVSPFNPLRKEIEGRLYVLLHRQIENQTQLMLAQEKSLDIISVPNNAIAVMYFANTTGESDLNILQKGLAEMIITDLSQVRRINVVERIRLQALLEELSLGQTGLIDPAVMPRVGRLLGAAHIVNGTLTGLGPQLLRIDAGLSHLKYGINREAERVTGPLQDLMRMEKDIVFGIIDKLGIKLTKEERKAIEKIPTDNVMAFMAYCRGLDLEDRGQWSRARYEYEKALQLDPNFTRAQLGLIKVDAFSHFKPTPPKPKLAEIVAKGKGRDYRKGKGRRLKYKRQKRALTKGNRIAARPVSMTAPSTTSRLFRSAEHVNPGFVPSIESRKPTTEENTPSFGTSAPIRIRVPIPTKP